MEPSMNAQARDEVISANNNTGTGEATLTVEPEDYAQIEAMYKEDYEEASNRMALLNSTFEEEGNFSEFSPALAAQDEPITTTALALDRDFLTSGSYFPDQNSGSSLHEPIDKPLELVPLYCAIMGLVIIAVVIYTIYKQHQICKKKKRSSQKGSGAGASQQQGKGQMAVYSVESGTPHSQPRHSKHSKYRRSVQENGGQMDGVEDETPLLGESCAPKEEGWSDMSLLLLCRMPEWASKLSFSTDTVNKPAKISTVQNPNLEQSEGTLSAPSQFLQHSTAATTGQYMSPTDFPAMTGQIENQLNAPARTIPGELQVFSSTTPAKGHLAANKEPDSVEMLELPQSPAPLLQLQVHEGEIHVNSISSPVCQLRPNAPLNSSLPSAFQDASGYSPLISHHKNGYRKGHARRAQPVSQDILEYVASAFFSMASQSRWVKLAKEFGLTDQQILHYEYRSSVLLTAPTELDSNNNFRKPSECKENEHQMNGIKPRSEHLPAPMHTPLGLFLLDLNLTHMHYHSWRQRHQEEKQAELVRRKAAETMGTGTGVLEHIGNGRKGLVDQVAIEMDTQGVGVVARAAPENGTEHRHNEPRLIGEVAARTGTGSKDSSLSNRSDGQSGDELMHAQGNDSSRASPFRLPRPWFDVYVLALALERVECFDIASELLRRYNVKKPEARKVSKLACNPDGNLPNGTLAQNHVSTVANGTMVSETKLFYGTGTDGVTTNLMTKEATPVCIGKEMCTPLLRNALTDSAVFENAAITKENELCA